MDQILIAWSGGAYIDASLKQLHGPISVMLQSGHYSHVYLLYNYPLDQTAPYIDWLKQHQTNIVTQYEPLPNPQDLSNIYQIAEQQFQVAIKQHKKAKLHLQITPATPTVPTYQFINVCCNLKNHLL